MKNIAIIPARSGSKGIENKNIRSLAGKPLLAYSIEAALASKCFDIVHVSTDSVSYADIARAYGADVPFLREPETSTDNASSWDAVREVLRKYNHMFGFSFETFMLLQPTSPLRTAHDIYSAYQLFREKKATSIVSVCEMDHSPLWSCTLPDDLSLSCFAKSNYGKSRRQDLQKYYRINGAIYLSSVSQIMLHEDIYCQNIYAYIMDKMKSIDIDEEFDFMICEEILRRLKAN